MCSVKSLLLFCLALLVVCGSGFAQDLTGIWKGKYSYPAESDREPGHFWVIMVQNESELFGFAKELNTFGTEEVPWLHAMLKGSVDKATGKIRFTKSYDGTGEQNHDVEYRGRVAENGTKVQGTWKIPDQRGADFTLEKVRKPGRCETSVVGVWAGEFQYPDDVQMPPVKFWMIVACFGKGVTGLVKEPNTFGEGDDPWLHALLKGHIDGETGRMTFTKTYDGTSGVDHEVKYEGRLSESATKLSGEWTMPDSWGGKFTAKKVAPKNWAELTLSKPMEVERIQPAAIPVIPWNGGD